MALSAGMRPPTPKSDVESRRSTPRRSPKTRSRTVTPKAGVSDVRHSQHKKQRRASSRNEVSESRHALTPSPSPSRTERRAKSAGKVPTVLPGVPEGEPIVTEAVSTTLKPESEVPTVLLDSSKADFIFDKIPADGDDPLPMPKSIRGILGSLSTEVPLEEFAVAFESLKSQIRLHCREHFAWHLPRSDRNDRSLLVLQAKAPHTFNYLRYLADGSQYGWDKLLNVANQRENLAYAMISRALFVHLFDQELFGAQEELNEDLLKMCRYYINYDAFVRNPNRAEMIIHAIKKLRRGTTRGNYFAPAVQTLSDQIQQLLNPLLQTPGGAAESEAHMTSLVAIIHRALKIHLAIRLRGAHGTVFHFEHTAKMSPWNSSVMNCVNQVRTDITYADGDEPLTKVACFPAVVVTEPEHDAPTLESFTDETFVENWVESASIDPESGKLNQPKITTYPLVMADVVLEQTPSADSDRRRWLTLDDALSHEARLYTDNQYERITGIDRRRLRQSRGLKRELVPFMTGAAAVLAPIGMHWLYTHYGSDFATLFPAVSAQLAVAKRAADQLAVRANLSTFRRAVRSATQVFRLRNPVKQAVRTVKNVTAITSRTVAKVTTTKPWYAKRPGWITTDPPVTGGAPEAFGPWETAAPEPTNTKMFGSWLWRQSVRVINMTGAEGEQDGP